MDCQSSSEPRAILELRAKTCVALDAVFAPRAALRVVVAQQRLGPVDGSGETGLGRLLRLELFPKRAHLLCLIVWQQAEDAVGGPFFAVTFANLRRRVVDKGVACVDLDDVVHEDHLEHTQEIHRFVGILSRAQSP